MCSGRRLPLDISLTHAGARRAGPSRHAATVDRLRKVLSSILGQGGGSYFRGFPQFVQTNA
jgi:hypothetical protein